MRQDYPQMASTSLLIADAGSTDRTVEIARSFGYSLNISIVPGGLPSVGRNAGARLATSRYLLFLDADIELADNALIGRALELMKRKNLLCLTTDIFCKDGGFPDRLLYKATNLAQRLSRLHKPFATGMFILVERGAFEALGGFDEQAIFAEDYQLTRRFPRRRFSTVRGGIYSTNRRFCKMGRVKMMRMFVSAALHSGSDDFFRRDGHRNYWQAY